MLKYTKQYDNILKLRDTKTREDKPEENQTKKNKPKGESEWD